MEYRNTLMGINFEKEDERLHFTCLPIRYLEGYRWSFFSEFERRG
jgi:hypothetical protein